MYFSNTFLKALHYTMKSSLKHNNISSHSHWHSCTGRKNHYAENGIKALRWKFFHPISAGQEIILLVLVLEFCRIKLNQKHINIWDRRYCKQYLLQISFYFWGNLNTDLLVFNLYLIRFFSWCKYDRLMLVVHTIGQMTQG